MPSRRKSRLTGAGAAAAAWVVVMSSTVGTGGLRSDPATRRIDGKANPTGVFRMTGCCLCLRRLEA
jgi:hypothetical protein